MTGTERAAARLAKHLSFTAERLANMPPSEPTRQQRRADNRRSDKMPVGASQAKWHKAKGFPEVKVRRVRAKMRD